MGLKSPLIADSHFGTNHLRWNVIPNSALVKWSVRSLSGSGYWNCTDAIKAILPAREIFPAGSWA